MAKMDQTLFKHLLFLNLFGRLTPYHREGLTVREALGINTGQVAMDDGTQT